jgi:DNA-binding FadR family transcriptional regulator
MMIGMGRQTPLAMRTSRAELMARELEREIVDGRQPGDRLGTKEDLRQRFNVAVATVNEAVRLLETHGLVEARPGPGGGVFVSGGPTRLTLRHIVLGFRTGETSYEECLELRDALEPVIDRHAARYHKPADIRALKQLLAQMENARDDPHQLSAANWALHRRIATLCRNAPLRAMYLSLIDFLQAMMNGAEFVDLDADAVCKVHRDLIVAIDAGEGTQLEPALDAHRPDAALDAHRPSRRRVARLVK